MPACPTVRIFWSRFANDAFTRRVNDRFHPGFPKRSTIPTHPISLLGGCAEEGCSGAEGEMSEDEARRRNGLLGLARRLRRFRKRPNALISE